jgi:hypothetical protein
MTIAHCRSEQLRCAAEFHDAGARLGMNDWFCEEFLMEQEKMTHTTDYAGFLSGKTVAAAVAGFHVDQLNQFMQLHQPDITRWALRRGRAAIFAGTGLGKTFMQLEWSHHVAKRFGKVLIVAPLAVGRQTESEAVKFGIDGAKYVANPTADRIQITNYEKLHRFKPSDYAGIVLDESSILKGFDGKFRKSITEFSSVIPYRLCASATPAPNDYMELGNHAEYLGVMSCAEMLAMFFTHDGADTSKWRLKKHAESVFWKWVCSWAVAIRKPSDIGYDDGAYELPALNIHQLTVESGVVQEGLLFQVEAESLQERQQARKLTIDQRVAECAKYANRNEEQWVIWCGRNEESSKLAAVIDGAVEVTGSQTEDQKEANLMKFINGSARVLVTKPEIAGFGLNLQFCHKVAFVGLSDSFEQYYQAVRRCWRFGQTEPVDVYVITADIEGAVVRNIQRKEDDAERMMEGMVEHMRFEMNKEIFSSAVEKTNYAESVKSGDKWTALMGDCVEQVSRLESASVGYSIFSPPFASLYTYSNSDRDMGNCKTYEDFEKHFKFLIPQLHRVLMPGRLLSFHCMNLPFSKERDGFIGIRDFRGQMIRWFEDCGFIFHSEVCIWKDPVTAMQRTKAIGLLYKQLRKDSAMSRQGIPDYLVTMRKRGVNSEPVTKTYESFPVDLWQRYASPVWMDIKQSKTLNRDGAKEENDERHICPLQLDVIERGVRLWSNPGDLILSPFMGIGSEGYVSIKEGRRFVGVELKPSYFDVACKNLKQAEHDGQSQSVMFQELERSA